VHFDSKNVLKHNFSNFCLGQKYEFTLTFVSFLKLVPDLKLDMLCPLFFFLSAKSDGKGEGVQSGCGWGMRLGVDQTMW
jgi:hypothetical protein